MAKLIKAGDDAVVLDARGEGWPAVRVAEEINRALGYATVGGQLEERRSQEAGLLIPREQAHIARMGSVDPEIYVGSRTRLQPQQTRALVRKHLQVGPATK